MGNGVAKLSNCFSGGGGGGSGRRRRLRDAGLPPPAEAYDDGLGHSFCYVRPEASTGGGAPASSAKVHHHQITSDESATTFRSISGASVSANASTPLSTSLLNELTWPAAAAFESSVSFASVPLHPIPDSQGFLSGPIERGFMSGPLTDPRLFSGPLPARPPPGLLRRSLSHAPRPRRAAASLLRGITKALALTTTWHSSVLAKPKSDSSTTSFPISFEDGGGGGAAAAPDSDTMSSDNLHWAQGKAGEDRVHVVISEEYGWVFVGIYDGFNGPDATDYLLSNLYPALHRHLKGLLWDDAQPQYQESDLNSSSGGAANHDEVLGALSTALRKTEEAYLDGADKMASENPELALMGSCVLVMLMKGEDVYVMNVGDSRAILARKESDLARQDLERIREEGSNELESYYSDDQLELAAVQLTLDHSTSMEEEVVRIKREHPDDASAIANNRVKGSLKVTRAFGAGFLKQPKWNDALLEVFRIDYVGTSPYITCNPSLYHHKLGPKDRFLILSSDGLYQYFTNEEAVSQVELFIATTPEGDPAQHLVEEVLFRAANKAGMDFHELLEIPQGDRRRYHDDVSIIVISLEGRIWKSCV